MCLCNNVIIRGCAILEKFEEFDLNLMNFESMDNNASNTILKKANFPFVSYHFYFCALVNLHLKNL